MGLLRYWLSTCSTSTTSSSASTPSPPLSDNASYYMDTPTQSSSSSSSTTMSTNSSIQSNASLLTLPSVQSLQKLAPQYYHTTTTATSFSVTTSLTVLTSLNKIVNFLALRNNLLYAATGDQVHVYETINNTLFDTFGSAKPSSGSIKSVAFVDGKVFTSHQDCKIRVWKLSDTHKKHKLVATLPTLEDRLLRFILPQNYVRVRRHKKKLWIEHHDAVSGLAVPGSDDHRIISVSWDRSIKIWKADKKNNFRCLESVSRAHDDAINAVVVSKDGVIYTGSADKKIKAWRKLEEACKKYELIATLEKHKSAVNALALSCDGSVLFSGSCDRSILVWEREDSASHMALTGALRGHAKAILCLINVRDLLMSGSADRAVRVWRRACGEDDDGRYCCLAVLDGLRTPVRSLEAVAEEDGGDGGCAAVKVFSGGFDGEVTVWRVEV